MTKNFSTLNNMEAQINNNVKLSSLTVGEFRELIKKEMSHWQTPKADKHWCRGIAEFAKALKVHRNTAAKIINSGQIDEAVVRNQRTIMVDFDKAVELLQKKPSHF